MLRALALACFASAAPPAAQADPSRSSVEIMVDGSIALSLGGGNILQLDGTSEVGSIQLQLDEEFSQRFEEVTETSIGKIVTVRICNQEVLSASVNAPISGGNLLLSGLSEAQLEDLMQVLSGEKDCK